MMQEKLKEFEIPEIEIIRLSGPDIITTSGNGDTEGPQIEFPPFPYNIE